MKETRKFYTEDLMIGDWVRWEGCAGNFRVCSIDGRSLMVEIEKHEPEKAEGWNADVFIDELSGITITPEILEKNGFVVGRKNFEYPSSCEYVWGDVYLLLVQCGEFYHCRMKKADGWLLTVYAMCYVHELQHAIRLAGIEKEIEL